MPAISFTLAVLNDEVSVREVRAEQPENMPFIFSTFSVLNVDRLREVRAEQP